jgi:hypothetical protein
MQRFLCDRWSSDSPGDHVLDLGAGLAPYAPVYRPYFHHATTVDVPYSPHAQDRIDVFASADDLPFDDETFDCGVVRNAAPPGVRTRWDLEKDGERIGAVLENLGAEQRCLDRGTRRLRRRCAEHAAVPAHAVLELHSGAYAALGLQRSEPDT